MLKRVRRQQGFIIGVAMLCLLPVVHPASQTQGPTPIAASSPSNPIPPRCKDGASPGVIQITPDPNSEHRFKLARKHFYLSSRPFDLKANNVDPRKAPSLRSFYAGKARERLMRWLETNNCETIYCREITLPEVTCQSSDPGCVHEFVDAYAEALRNLNENEELARKWITNYPPLSLPELRTGFFEAKTAWLKAAVEALEKTPGQVIKSTISDKDGIAFFYDLCPGDYYVSSIAPIEIEGGEIFWEATKPVKVEGPPDKNTATLVTLAFPPAKDRKNVFVGKPVAPQ